MPEMLGTELVEKVRAIRARPAGSIYMSGYSHEVLAPRALTENGRQRLHREALQRAAPCWRPCASCSTRPARRAE